MRRTARSFGIWAVAMAIVAGMAPAARAREEPDSPAEPLPIEAGVPIVAPRPAPKVETPPVAHDLEEAKTLDALLKEWERRSAEIRELDASFRRVDRKLGVKGVTNFEGRALLKGANLSCFHIDKVEQNPNPEGSPRKHFQERVIRAGNEVVKYDGVGRQIVFYPESFPARNGTPRRGPLPFLFGVKAEELRAKYRVRLRNEGRDAYRVEFSPRASLGVGELGNGTRLLLGFLPWGGVDGEFSRAVVDLSRDTWLPNALMIVSADGGGTQTYVFKEIKANATVAADNFRIRNLAGWAVVRPPTFLSRRQVASHAPRADDGGEVARPDGRQVRPR